MSTNIIASAHLGKVSLGSEVYNPSLLVAVPRKENRSIYNIDNNNLIFDGFDVWHAYEFSALTQKGLPVTKLLKIRYGCDNPYIVESKSLKLYLNSFNMSRYGENIQDCLDICKNMIEKDLSEVLKTNVNAAFLDNNAKRIEIYENFINILNLVDEEKIIIDKFKEAPELLDVETLDKSKEYFLHFDSLRSNCRVTHQPDFGDAFIYYRSDKHIKEESLIEYLTSFRSEYHFHEECCEMIFKRLYDILDENDLLFVCTLYTRRGGIDICPVRWSKNFQPEFVKPLLELTQFARNGIKQ